MRRPNGQIHANLVAPWYEHTDREAEFEKKATSTPPNPLVVGVCLIIACAVGYMGQAWGGL